MNFSFNDDTNVDLDRVGAARTIVIPPLALGMMFNITSMMIQMLNLMGLFGRLCGDDPNMHLVNFKNIYKSFG